MIVLGSILLFGGYSFSKQMIFSIKDCFVLRQVEVTVAHLFNSRREANHFWKKLVNGSLSLLSILFMSKS